LKTRYGDDYVVTGIDVAGPALDYAQRKGVPVVRESFLEMAHQEKQFSAITFWAVIEHLADPGRFLAKAASLLEPSGYCFVLVPNFHSLAVRLLGAKYRYIFPQHVNYFTPSTLARFIEGAPNLGIVYAGTMHFNPLVVWQDWRGNGAFVADEARARLLKRTTGYKQNPALKPLKFALACGEAVLGRLKLADNIVLVLQKSEPRRTAQLGDT
jgi:2-polyprenyl-3-methyl-5-hydroxy-6-metoxy-1,4-benzoquinol methylase